MTDEEATDFRPPGNIKVTTEQPFISEEESAGVLKTIVEATKEVVAEFEHTIRNEEKGADGKYKPKMIEIDRYYQTDEKGEKVIDAETGMPKIVIEQGQLPPAMNELGISHYRAFFMNTSINIATSQYERKEAQEDILDLEDTIADDLFINEERFEIAQGDMQMLDSIIRSNLKACINKAINAKFLDAATRQITHSETAMVDKQKSGFGAKIRRFLGEG